MSPSLEDRQPGRLEEIATEWDVVRDPGRFVLHYAPAVRNYLTALLRNLHDAEEAAQDFLLRVVQHGFVRVREDGGRFRDYLKSAVRNAARNFLRRRKGPRFVEAEAALRDAPDKVERGLQERWLDEWRRCLLDRARQALARRQSRTPGNLFHTVLGLIVDNPLDDARTLAARASALLGRPLKTEAFRQQVSRARRAFAVLLAREAALTLDQPTADEIRDELIELALWEYVRDYLPERWAADIPGERGTSAT
jgi:RNA polymerase sigma-70 factor (ECF subfamily)